MPTDLSATHHLSTSSLSDRDRDQVAAIARKTGFSLDAVEAMLRALVRGGGRMAQFDRLDFGGSGQWMQGGMLMIAGPVSRDLKRRVQGLCDMLSDWLARDPSLLAGSGLHSQSQFQRQSADGFAVFGRAEAGVDDGAEGSAQDDSYDGAEDQRSIAREDFDRSALFDRTPSDEPWYPPSLGHPAGSGAQNGMRYAWFRDARRLAVDDGGTVSVYETGDHRIGGVAQQQGSGATVAFTSQHGPLDLARLTRVDDAGTPAPRAPHAPAEVVARRPSSAPRGPSAAAATDASHDPFVALEKLASLHARGILGDDEFAAKKSELLKRI